MPSRPWTRFYAPETHEDLPPVEWRHLPDLLRASASTYHAQEAFALLLPNGMRGSLTFAEVDALSDAFAVYLRSCAGLAPGDRVALQMPNCLAYPVCVFGVLKAGLVLVNTNPLYTPAEMASQFADSGATALVIIDLFGDRLAAMPMPPTLRTVVVVNIADLFAAARSWLVRTVQRYVKREIPAIALPHVSFRVALREGQRRMREGADARAYASSLSHATTAALQYTGGTTGISKGAVLSHGNLLANIAQCIEVWRPRAIPGREVVLTALPLYHVFAFTANLMVFFSLGGRNVLIPSPRPLANLRQGLLQEGITWLTGVNTLFAGLLQEPWFIDHRNWMLKGSIAGGMALQRAIGERWETVTGTPMFQGYGLTETSPVVALVPFHRGKPDSIGVPVPGTDVRVVDGRGHDVSADEPGELLVRGPQVMQGYWQRPDETARVLQDGWLSTGDVATLDAEGYLSIVDRKKDMVIVSGFNVYPNEVEAVLAAHPDVREVAVIGVPDSATGERVVAYVTPGRPTLTEEELRVFCRQSLTPYKVPKQVVFRDTLPKSPVGKVLRKALRDDAGVTA